MFTVPPGAVYFHVSSLPNDTEVRIDWVPPLEPSTVITSYEVIYSVYEAVNIAQRVKLNSSTTSYAIQNLSKWLTICKAGGLMTMLFLQI